jgi:hypothetical protein
MDGNGLKKAIFRSYEFSNCLDISVWALNGVKGKY